MELGPVEILYCWQSVLVAIIISFVVSVAKQSLTLLLGSKGKRKENIWITSVILPLLPVVLGFLIGVYTGLQPEKLVEYVVARNIKHIDDIKHPWIIYGAWGSAVGVFADYLYTRAKALFETAVVLRTNSTTPPATIPPAR